MVGSRLLMSTLAEIPEEDIQGARAPFLHYGRKLFEVLHENGFRYESSIVEQSFIVRVPPASSTRFSRHPASCCFAHAACLRRAGRVGVRELGQPAVFQPPQPHLPVHP